MKANTQVVAAFRNIGDSNDSGTFFEGEVKEVILWIATQLANATMQKRIAIGIGRDKAGAAAGIDLKRGSSRHDLDGLGGALDALFDGESPETVLAAVEPSAGASRDPRDTWEGATQ